VTAHGGAGAGETELVPPVLSPAELVGYVREVEAAADIRYNQDMRVAQAGLIVLARFFGPEWVDLRILRKSPFLHPSAPRAVDELKRQDRIVMLAEHMVNLQGITGFSWCLNEIQTDSIETGLAKLIGAGMLRRLKIPFRFVKPSGRKGRDYDAEARVGSTTVPAEMKANIEGKAPTPEAIANALRVARKQLPKDTSNLVFLRVPEVWGETAEGVKAIRDGVLREFENSGRIGVVVVHWEYWRAAPTVEEPEGAARGTRRAVIGSRRARASIKPLIEALTNEPPGATLEWLSIHRLFPP
jgi:hypothetical protein